MPCIDYCTKHDPRTMPYIKKGDRAEIDVELDALLNALDSTNAGELNYVITRVLTNHLRFQKVGYTELNKLIGVLECAKLELYRRLAAPYEDKKIEENGDVY